MKIFSKLYAQMMHWSTHRHAPYYLSGLSFIEAAFFPLPPDVMLAPMSLSKPHMAWRYAAMTAVASTLGGVMGYCIGYFAFEFIYPWIVQVGYDQAYQTAKEWFKDWGIWAMFIAAFTPIPFKVFTVAAGALNMAIIPFVLSSLMGRCARFFLVAGLMRWGGERMDTVLRKIVDVLGWVVIVLAIILYLILR